MAVSAVADDKEIQEDASSLADVLPVSDESQPADVISSGGSEGTDEGSDASAISEDARSLAKDYGFNPDVFGSDDNVRAAVAALDRQAAEYVRLSRERQREASSNPPAAQTPAVPADKGQKPKIDFDKLFPKDQIDETLAGGLKTLYQDLVDQLAERDTRLSELGSVKDRVQQLQDYHAQQEGLRFERDMDSWFAGLSDEWSEVFGKQAMRSLKDHVPTDIVRKQARHKIVEQLELLQEVDRLRGRPQRPMQDYANAALRYVFSDKTDTAARRQVTTELNKRAKGAALAHGKGKVVQPVEPEERAMSALQKVLNKHGFNSQHSHGDEE